MEGNNGTELARAARKVGRTKERGEGRDKSARVWKDERMRGCERWIELWQRGIRKIRAEANPPCIWIALVRSLFLDCSLIVVSSPQKRRHRYSLPADSLRRRGQHELHLWIGSLITSQTIKNDKTGKPNLIFIKFKTGNIKHEWTWTKSGSWTGEHVEGYGAIPDQS